MARAAKTTKTAARKRRATSAGTAKSRTAKSPAAKAPAVKAGKKSAGGKRRAAVGAHPVESVESTRKKISNKLYLKELAKLQIELVKLQEWIKHEGLKVVALFEGRDAAGKGGVIKRITESLNPRICRVVALGTPTEREKTQWYFQRYVPHLPAAGEMVLFDRSWYNRAGVERVMGFCSDEEYSEFMRSCPEFERMLVRSGILLVKYWFSVSDEEQERRFQGRIKDPTKRWKLSPMDLESRRLWRRVLTGQGRYVPAHRHQAGAVVRGRGRRQEARPAELHPPPPGSDPLSRPDAGAGQAAEAAGRRGLRASAHDGPDLRAGQLLNAPDRRRRVGRGPM